MKSARSFSNSLRRDFASDRQYIVQRIWERYHPILGLECYYMAFEGGNQSAWWAKGVKI